MNNSDEIKITYNKIARAYHQKRLSPENSSWNDLLERPAMEAMLKPLVKNQSVLDLGCGTGLLTKEIIDWGGEAFGVDLSEEMITIARENYPDIRFEISASDKLPYNNNYFDLVASSLVMHYIKNLLPTFIEIGRILKNNGQFVFSMHHPFNESFNLKKEFVDGKPLLQPYFHNNSYYWRMCGADILSFHHTFENVIQNLKSAGFVLVDIIECRPDQEAQDSFADYDFTSSYPTFCVFHAALK